MTAVANAVRDGGRLATITGDPPDEQRGIENSSVIVQPDGPGLGAAFAAATEGGAGGAVVLRP